MRAIGVTQFGGPEALHEIDVPPEPIGPGRVRVRVRAAAVSPTDTLVRSGARADGDRAPDPGAVPGMDVAGEVVELGEGTGGRFVVGGRVMGVVVPQGAHGAYREELVLPADSLARVPDGASDVEASTLPMNGLTARMALEALDLARGQVLAVTGAAGAFGGYVVQLAKADGLTVVADASEADEALVRSLGADEVVARGDGFADRVRALHPDGVDGLADGAVQDAAALPAVKDGGAVATVRGYTGDGQRGLRVTPVLVHDAAERPGALDGLRQQVEAGEVTLRVADVLPAAQAPEAHRRLEAGGVRGRLVLDLS